MGEYLHEGYGGRVKEGRHGVEGEGGREGGREGEIE